jgi:hypothetical protein
MLYDGYGKMFQSNMNTLEMLETFGDDEDAAEGSIIANSKQMLDKISEMFDKLKGVSIFMTTSFEKGVINSKSSIWFDSPESKEAYNELQGNYFEHLNGDILKYFGESPIFLAAMNINGANYMKVFEQLGLTSFVQTLDFDVVKLISALNGDLALSLNRINIAEKKPLFSVFATVTNVDEINLEIEKIVAKHFPTAQKLVNGTYVLANSFEIYFGIKNSIFYIANDLSVVENIGKDVSTNYYTEKIKGTQAYFYGDLRELKQEVLTAMEGDSYLAYRHIAEEGLSLIETSEGRNSDEYNGEFNIYFADKDKNSLAAIFQFIDHTITNAAALR